MKQMLSLTFILLSLSCVLHARPLTDHDLDEVLQNESQGIIYLWNPLMPLSTMGLEEARQVAKDMNLHFTETDQLSSSRLAKMGVLNHFPAIVTFKDGKVFSSLIQGYEVPEGLKSYLGEILENGRINPVQKKNHSFRPRTYIQQLNEEEMTVLPSRMVNEVRSPDLPSFFFKVSSDGKYISYTLPPTNSNYGAGTNYLVNTTVKERIHIPGPWDPVFNVDAETMTLPVKGSGRDIYYQMYDFKKLLTQGKDAGYLYQDKTMKGLYQSVGILEDSEEIVKYRVIAEGNISHDMRDYSYNRTTGEFAPLSERKSLCHNQKIKLPMISKNGQEMAGIDMTTRTTAVFLIKEDGSCDKVTDLGKKTGKVNFSHDNRYLTFHIYSETTNNDLTEGYVAVPGEEYTSDIYIYDRTQSKFYKITQNKSANALYPDFTKNGELVYAYYPRPKSKGVYYRFLQVKGIGTTHFPEINSLEAFETELAKLTEKHERRDFFQSFLIENSQINISKTENFLSLLATAREFKLESELTEKAINNGMSIANEEFAKNLYTNSPLLFNEFLIKSAKGSVEAASFLYNQLLIGDIYEQVNETIIRTMIAAKDSITSSDITIILDYIYSDHVFNELFEAVLAKDYPFPTQQLLHIFQQREVSTDNLYRILQKEYLVKSSGLIEAVLKTPQTSTTRALVLAASYNYVARSCVTLETMRSYGNIDLWNYSEIIKRSLETVDCSAADLYQIVLKNKDLTVSEMLAGILAIKDSQGLALLNLVNLTIHRETAFYTEALKQLLDISPSINSEALVNFINFAPSDFTQRRERLSLAVKAKRWDVLRAFEMEMLIEHKGIFAEQSVSSSIYDGIIRRHYPEIILHIRTGNDSLVSDLTQVFMKGHLKISISDLGVLLIKNKENNEIFARLLSIGVNSKMSLRKAGLLKELINGSISGEARTKLFQCFECAHYQAEMHDILNHMMINYASTEYNSLTSFIDNARIKTFKSDQKILRKNNMKKWDKPLYEKFKEYIKANRK